MADMRSPGREEIEDLLVVRAQQSEMLRQLHHLTDDHERRIRFLERVIGYGTGAVAALKLLLDYIHR